MLSSETDDVLARVFVWVGAESLYVLLEFGNV